tara:strand:- start:263 stop:661 length:399 start_codon:yes stop_codon:yes gene_type:complete
MILTGEKVNVNTSIQNIKLFLTDSKNIEDLLPKEKISDFQSDELACSFKVQGGITISLVQNGVEANKIFLRSGEKSPFPFQLTIHLNFIEEHITEGHIEFDGEVNAFLKMMVEKPLTSLFNYMSKKLSSHFS